MSTDRQLREIEAVADEVLDVATRKADSGEPGSRQRSYEKSIDAVRDVAGDAEAAELTEWIQAEIRSRGDYPPGREVRQTGAEICRRTGHSIPTDSWLGA